MSKNITEQSNNQDKALVHTEQGNLVRAAEANDVIAAFQQYQKIQEALDKMLPDCILTIRGKNFRKKNYWRAIATAFNLNVELVNERRVEIEGDWGYEVCYSAIAQNGRSAHGDGSCMASEKVSETSGIFATLHNVRSHAHTRAFNRAVSNLVGFGEVSAEEIVQQAPNETRKSSEAKAAPSGGRKATEKQTKMLWAKAKARSEVVGIAADQILKDAYGTLGIKSKQDVLVSHVDTLVQFIESYDPTPAEEVPF